MLRSLIWINFKTLFSGAGRGNKSKKRSIIGVVAMALLLLYAICVMGASIGMIFYGIFEPFSSIGLEWFVFALAGILSFCICFIFSIFAAKAQLFEAGDNELLLSMPIKPITILISRLVSLLLVNYIYSAIVMIPVLAIWLMLGKVTALSLLCYVLVFLTLPFLALTFSCIFGWLLAIITSKMRNKNIVTIVFSLGCLLLYFTVYSKIGNYITTLIVNGETIAYSLKKAVLPAYLMGDAIANGNIISLILFILIAIIPFMLILLLLNRSFISITTSNRGKIKVAYKEKHLKSSGVGMALFKKELRRYISCPIYVMNSSLGSVFVILLAFYMLFKQSTLYQMTDMLRILNINVPIASIALILLCISMNMISAPSVSLEGKNLWIIQTLPISSKTILIFKAVPHFVITEASILIGASILGILLKASAFELLLMYLLPTVFNAFTALAGVAINLRFPRFDWVSETHAVKQGAAVFVAMITNIITAAAPIFIYLYLAADVMSIATFALIYTVFLAALAVTVYIYLCSKGCKRFENL